MEHCRLQIGCLIILLYIAYIYIRECREYHRSLKDTFFDELLVMSVISVIFDGITAYTVNNLETVNPVLNMALHAAYMITLEAVVFFLFIYMLKRTDVFPKKKTGYLLVSLPFTVGTIVILLNISSIEYTGTAVSNYATGVSAYACFIMAAVYIILTFVTFFKNWNYFESHNRASVLTYLLVLLATTAVQFFFNDMLITSAGVTVFILGIYMNAEDPALRELSRLHSETVMSFAGLIENRDNSTGGHIKRTSRYVKLIAEELRERGLYDDILTKDYTENLIKAAPMHDIGKISVPDAILQKPGKLTDDEFAAMKLHAPVGGDIIREVFRNLGDEDYRKMAFEVARYHHPRHENRC